MRCARRQLFLTIVATAAVAAGLRAGQLNEAAVPAKMPTVLFMCPHGAAKSVLASAYFERLAKERGLSVRVESAGTDPDAAVSPTVAAHLNRLGYAARASAPRKVTSADLDSADVVILMGCDLTGLPQPRGRLGAVGRRAPVERRLRASGRDHRAEGRGSGRGAAAHQRLEEAVS